MYSTPVRQWSCLLSLYLLSLTLCSIFIVVFLYSLSTLLVILFMYVYCFSIVFQYSISMFCFSTVSLCSMSISLCSACYWPVHLCSVLLQYFSVLSFSVSVSLFSVLFSGWAPSVTDRNTPTEQPPGADVTALFCDARNLQWKDGPAQTDVLYDQCKEDITTDK